jgi:hypothetical protein
MISLKVLEVMNDEERITYVQQKLITQGENRYKISLKQATRYANFVDCSLIWGDCDVSYDYLNTLNLKVIDKCQELPFY